MTDLVNGRIENVIMLITFAGGSPMNASHIPEQNPVVPVLQSLIDRLSAPDLTVDEANELRPRLLRVLEAIETRPTLSDEGSFAGDA